MTDPLAELRKLLEAAERNERGWAAVSARDSALCLGLLDVEELDGSAGYCMTLTTAGRALLDLLRRYGEGGPVEQTHCNCPGPWMKRWHYLIIDRLWQRGRAATWHQVAYCYTCRSELSIGADGKPLVTRMAPVGLDTRRLDALEEHCSEWWVDGYDTEDGEPRELRGIADALLDASNASAEGGEQ